MSKSWIQVIVFAFMSWWLLDCWGAILHFSLWITLTTLLCDGQYLPVNQCKACFVTCRVRKVCCLELRGVGFLVVVLSICTLYSRTLLFFLLTSLLICELTVSLEDMKSREKVPFFTLGWGGEERGGERERKDFREGFWGGYLFGSCEALKRFRSS